MISLALFQPDIPQNVGASMRLCACLDIPLHIIEPCGFPWDEKKIKQSALDYLTKIKVSRHSSWQTFEHTAQTRRIILMTTKTDTLYTDFEFRCDDILLAGSESTGVPSDIHERADARITIPMQEGLRSLNIVNASSMILGEALRQTRWSKAHGS